MNHHLSNFSAWDGVMFTLRAAAELWSTGHAWQCWSSPKWLANSCMPNDVKNKTWKHETKSPGGFMTYLDMQHYFIQQMQVHPRIFLWSGTQHSEELESSTALCQPQHSTNGQLSVRCLKIIFFFCFLHQVLEKKPSYKQSGCFLSCLSNRMAFEFEWLCW